MEPKGEQKEKKRKEENVKWKRSKKKNVERERSVKKQRNRRGGESVFSGEVR